ncbi:hypothetical protein MANES_11G131901v8 [Manihot esculenta]|uniref:Uncharacterized protein n=1 Tax=Manihot esculenta TaxID=3983 RepID=A0ACB7GVT1_MANES|nr:hypothetical protein MANES_11G131901v8 [Manihot esculenta]
MVIISPRVKFSLHVIPPITQLDSSIDSRAESLLYRFTDAAAAVDAASVGAASSSIDAALYKNGGWFGFISESMEFVLKVLKNGFSAVHVPYAYGFAIVFLAVIVKIATLPLTKQQVESTLAMQNLTKDKSHSTKICRQSGYFPTLVTITVWIGLYQALSNVANEGFFGFLFLGGPTTIAARQSGSGISWLFPFVCEEVLEEAYVSSASKQVPNISRLKRSKQSKRKHAV